MKFARQLNEDAVPEWRDQYFNYKDGKKKVKAVGKAIRSVPDQQHIKNAPGSSLRDGPVLSLFTRKKTDTAPPPPRLHHVRTQSDSGPPNGAPLSTTSSRPINERSPLQHSNGDRPAQRMTSYGSIIGSPPHSPLVQTKSKQKQAPPSLELPAPAVSRSNTAVEDAPVSPTSAGNTLPRLSAVESIPEGHAPPPTQLAHTGNAYQIRAPNDNPLPKNPRLRSLLPKRTSSMDGPFGRRLFSQPQTPNENGDIALEAYKEVDFRQGAFFVFLDKELAKIEKFYKEREEYATERLQELRTQLHLMRDYRLREILAAEERHQHGETAPEAQTNGRPKENANDANLMLKYFTKPFIDATERLRAGHVGKTSKAMGKLGSPDLDRGNAWRPDMDQRDYRRKPVSHEVSYRVAKRKMKLALAEYYRGLELLRSYAMANRTAFRKITKKYTKKTGCPTDYNSEKASKAYFVTSEEADKLIGEAVDLYSRYFERGNRKVAISKLRGKAISASDYTPAVARSCALLGAGLVLAIQGLISGVHDLHDGDSDRAVQASYALQLYGGFFLTLLLAFCFTGAAWWFHVQKVNMAFIFELDKRTALSWHQIGEIPSWLFFMMGLVMYLHFAVEVGGNNMYIWWPLVLIVAAVAFIFMPFKFYWRARTWLIASLWRLLFAGLYDVEFRDFFLGDMFCSLTYAMGNIELFFGLYVNRWIRPVRFNSSHSRLLGFLTTLPGIWRAFQCLRRYRDSRDVFPHLVNCGKYGFTILMYMSLSLYRVNHSSSLKAFFIGASTVNSVYCSVWDIVMDWSLGDTQHKGLRTTLVYKKHKWMYYVAMVIDPILRFNWIFYAIYTEDIQHSTICSFLVSLSEVLRRGMWTLFRVENEQSLNIEKLKASKDLPLPYKLADEPEGLEATLVASEDGTAASQSPDVERGTQRSKDSPAQAMLQRVGSTMRTAHAKDYERRKPKEEALEDEDDEDDSEDE